MLDILWEKEGSKRQLPEEWWLPGWDEGAGERGKSLDQDNKEDFLASPLFPMSTV